MRLEIESMAITFTVAWMNEADTCGPFLLTWINFNPVMDISNQMHYIIFSKGEITNTFLNFNGVTVEI